MYYYSLARNWGNVKGLAEITAVILSRGLVRDMIFLMPLMGNISITEHTERERSLYEPTFFTQNNPMKAPRPDRRKSDRVLNLRYVVMQVRV